jgi:hypothetical protein
MHSLSPRVIFWVIAGSLMCEEQDGFVRKAIFQICFYDLEVLR